jgi:hypothetical protein
MTWWWRRGVRVYEQAHWEPRRPLGVSRRAFLRGASVSLALPLLPSALPRSSWAAGGEAPSRLVFYYVPNGMQMQWWTPSAEGVGYDLPSILEPLASIQDKVSVLTGLSNLPAAVPVAGDHARGTGSFLTCRTVVRTDGPGISNGVSVDQVAAQVFGDQTPLPSLQLGMDGGASVGNCDSGYSCAYSRNISWSAPQTPLPKMTDPRLVFARLFEGEGDELPPEEAARRRELRLSVLDEVLGQANSLRPILGRGDQLKLEEYMDGVRALELRIEGLGQQFCASPGEPAPGLDHAERLLVMHELMTVALECDLTRVITFMTGNGASGRNFFPMIGVAGAHHQLSHHQGNAESLEKLRQIGQWEVSMLADLLTRMQARDEGGGCSILDNSAVYFSSEIADGNSHAHRLLPVLLAGSAGGQLNPGRHVVFPDDTPMANLYLRLLETFGVFESSFGADSTGVLTGA